MSSSPKSEVHIPHDGSERIVEGADRSDVSVADNATISHENAPKFDQALAMGEHDSENVTTRHPARGDSNIDPAPAREVPRNHLAQMRFETELAELTVRKTLLETELAELHVRKASAEFNAAELRTATLELEWKTEDARSRRGSRPVSEDARSRHESRQASPLSPTPSPPRSPQSPHSPVIPPSQLGIPELSTLMHFFASHQRDADARDARRDAQYRRDADARDAHYLALIAASQTQAARNPSGYVPNKGYADLPTFSGAQGGPRYLRWVQLFRTRANLLGSSDHDAARELCLKLTDTALQAYSRGFAADSRPTFAAVVAQLSKEFIRPYQGATRWAAYFRYKRPAGSSGKEVKQQLHAARQDCLDDNIPLDSLSPAEHLFYVYQLSLSAAQSAHFLASLSSNPQASDDYLRSLTPGEETDRRESLTVPQNSDARTACFQLRVTLIEAFLDHDNGDPGHGGTARAAVTSADTLEDPSPRTPGSWAGGVEVVTPDAAAAGRSPQTTLDVQVFDRECRLNVARANRILASKDSTKPMPPPEYCGSNPQHLEANKKRFLARQAKGECFACPEGELQHGVNFLHCKQHGREATTQQRLDPAHRVTGSIVPVGRNYGQGY